MRITEKQYNSLPEYMSKHFSKEDGVGVNAHPTVKPIRLMKYLCELIAPPGGIVLDPFMGSGSTGVAALEGGCRFIGIEMDSEYQKISARRLKATEKRPKSHKSDGKKKSSKKK